MLANVVRDAEVHPLTREMFERYVAPDLKVIGAVLAETLPGGRRRTVQAALEPGTRFRYLALARSPQRAERGASGRAHGDHLALHRRHKHGITVTDSRAA